MNMKKEYRDELKQLDRAERKLERDAKRHTMTNYRQIMALQRLIKRGRNATDREINRIAKRRAILRGRMD